MSLLSIYFTSSTICGVLRRQRRQCRRLLFCASLILSSELRRPDDIVASSIHQHTTGYHPCTALKQPHKKRHRTCANSISKPVSALGHCDTPRPSVMPAPDTHVFALGTLSHVHTADQSQKHHAIFTELPNSFPRYGSGTYWG